MTHISLDSFILIVPAFLAGAVIALAHVPLGIEVLRRGIIFLDLAVAQFAALGMIIFTVFFDNHDSDPRISMMGSLIFGLMMALVCSSGLHFLEKKAGKYQEALIGSAFIFSASLSIILMSGSPHSGEQMKDILAGQILWITGTDLLLYGPVFIVIASIFKMSYFAKTKLFYILFALTIPFSVNLIGVYLVFASLILPALATVHITQLRSLKAYGLTLASFALGLLASYLADLPAGPAIVIALFVVTGLFFVTRKKL